MQHICKTPVLGLSSVKISCQSVQCLSLHFSGTRTTRRRWNKHYLPIWIQRKCLQEVGMLLMILGLGIRFGILPAPSVVGFDLRLQAARTRSCPSHKCLLLLDIRGSDRSESIGGQNDARRLGESDSELWTDSQSTFDWTTSAQTIRHDHCMLRRFCRASPHLFSVLLSKRSRLEVWVSKDIYKVVSSILSWWLNWYFLRRQRADRFGLRFYRRHKLSEWSFVRWTAVYKAEHETLKKNTMFRNPSLVHYSMTANIYNIPRTTFCLILT